MSSKVTEYLNNLPDNVEKIDLSNKKLYELPDLSRFYNLKYLHCENNNLTGIPNFPNLKILDCNYNFIISLPIFLNIEILYCNSNRLTSLPIFPNLKSLECQDNRITSLPIFPNLQKLQCCNNKLTSIPSFTNLKVLHCGNNKLNIIMPRNLDRLHCYTNPISDVLGFIDTIQKLRILNQFRYLYYSLKFKKRFRDFLWIRIREPKIREKYSHDYLVKNLHEDTDLDELLENW